MQAWAGREHAQHGAMLKQTRTSNASYGTRLVVHGVGRGLEHVDALHSAVVAEQGADVLLWNRARDLGDEQLWAGGKCRQQ